MTPIPDRPWTRHLILAVALFLLLSSGMHGFFGWKFVHAALVEVHASNDLLETVALGWFLGSAAMVAFGLIAWSAWSRARRLDGGGLPSAGIVAAVYFLFGLGAFVLSGFQPHFLIFFMTPGALLGAALVASRPDRTETP
jgi:hypothetical protein